MTFEGGYDDRWILEDIVKDESYHLMVMSMGLSSIEDSNLRQLVSRMLSDVGHHVEQLAAISRATRHRVRQPAAPAPVQALGERPWEMVGSGRTGDPGRTMEPGRTPDLTGEVEPTRREGWQSPIPQGRGAYYGPTQSRTTGLHTGTGEREYQKRARGLDAEHREPGRQSSHRGVPRYRDSNNDIERDS